MSCTTPDPEGSTAIGLLEHLAIVNGHEALADEESELMAWAQNILSRVYALQICLR